MDLRDCFAASGEIESGHRIIHSFGMNTLLRIYIRRAPNEFLQFQIPFLRVGRVDEIMKVNAWNADWPIQQKKEWMSWAEGVSRIQINDQINHVAPTKFPASPSTATTTSPPAPQS